MHPLLMYSFCKEAIVSHTLSISQNCKHSYS